MQNAYIVGLKNAKNPHFSSKTGQNDENMPFFGENRAKSDVFCDFWEFSGLNYAKTQKSPFFGKSSLKLFEFSLIRGRVKSYSFWAIETKNRLPLRGWRF